MEVAKFQSLGLVALHSYGLIQAAEVTDKYGNLVRLVQLRNPWGKFEWHGDWGDESDLWTPQLIRQLGFSKNVNDGLFWMNIDDFR